MSNWQPIETAPKDGTRILLWWPYWCTDKAIIGSYNFDHDEWDSMDALSGVDCSPPTHWASLLGPPEQSDD